MPQGQVLPIEPIDDDARHEFSSSGAGCRIPAEITTRQWHVIEAVVDNEVNTRAEEGDADFVNTGLGVRSAGWGQVAHSTPGMADKQTVTVTLTSDQWTLVLLSLDIAAGISQATDDHESALAPRAIRVLVSAQLDDQLP